METENRVKHISPRGVIGCLAAGFEMVGRNLLVVAVPVAIDLFLWLGPRVSVSPLIQSIARYLRAQSSADPDIVGQMAQATELLEQVGSRFNLLSAVSGVPLLQVPSLLARRGAGLGSPLSEPSVFSLSSPLALIPSWVGLALVGLVIGFLYMNEIAHQVGLSGIASDLESEVTAGRKSVADDGSIRSGIWKFLRFMLFALGLLVIGSTVIPLWLLIVALGTVIVEPLGVLLWVAGVGFIGYGALHLIFVVPGILLGERPLHRAIGESMLLTHLNLPPVLGLIVLAVVIYEGLGYAWSLPANDSWALLVGIVGNAFVATSLTGAAFIFYRERLAFARRLALLGD